MDVDVLLLPRPSERPEAVGKGTDAGSFIRAVAPGNDPLHDPRLLSVMVRLSVQSPYHTFTPMYCSMRITN